MHTFGQQSPVTSPVADPASPSVPKAPVACAKEDIHNPRILTKVDPEYTAEALRKKVHGAVTVNLVVNERGIPEHVTLYEGLEEGLNGRAIEAVERWRFFPATCKDVPIAYKAVVTVEFKVGSTPTPTSIPAISSVPVAIALPVAQPSAPVVPTAIGPVIIKQGSTVYVNSNNGFDMFILAAFGNKHVLLTLVSTPEQAEYILDSSLFHGGGFVATRGLATTYQISEAAFTLTSKTGNIVWAYAATKGLFSGSGKQAVAEACAKHLKAHMDGKE